MGVSVPLTTTFKYIKIVPLFIVTWIPSTEENVGSCEITLYIDCLICWASVVAVVSPKAGRP